MAMLVRRGSAVKLVDDLAGESPASADYPVGTVVISGDGAGVKHWVRATEEFPVVSEDDML